MSAHLLVSLCSFFIGLSGEAFLHPASPFVSIALTTVSRDTRLSNNPLPQPACQPANQQTAVEEPLSLICLSSADRELPLGAAMTSQAAWETAWWQLCSVLLLFALILPTVCLNTKSF